MAKDDLHAAFRSYESVDPAAPEGDKLNLAWTRDERQGLAVDLSAVLAAELRAEVDDGLVYLQRYLVRDPYGEQTLGPSVAAAFGLPAWRGHVTCGAGVVSLLYGMARLSKIVRIVGDTYPDVPYWVTSSGGSVAPSAPVWFVERPSLCGDKLANVSELDALCEDAVRHRAIVIVDESNANYYPPEWSAVRLALAHDNLVVIRGFSKGYGLGGLRLAYAVASPDLTDRIRGVLPPLLASSLSLRLGGRVLALGDLTSSLRIRIDAHKREVFELFQRAGVEALVSSSEHLPYVLSRSSDLAALEARGILGKHHPYWSADSSAFANIYRLSVPISDVRMARLRHLLA